MARRVIMVGIDGCHQATLYRLIDRGEAPFLAQLAENGTRVERASTMFPSTTVSCCAALYTGCLARNNGILNNEWLDRFSTPPRARTYIAGLHYALAGMDRKLFGWPTIFLPDLKKGGTVNNDLLAPTIYDELTRAGKTSYTFFHYVGRGATRWVRPARTDMMRFAYAENWTKPLQNYEKMMVTRAIQNIRRHGMPDLLSIYFGCNDGHSHRHGVAAQADYIRDFIDPEMQRLNAELERACPGEDIFWAITADHGQSTLSDEDRERCIWADDYFPVLNAAGIEKVENPRSDHDIEPLDAVVSLGHGAGMGFYIKNKITRDWKTLPDFDNELVPVLNNMLRANAQLAPFQDWKFPGCTDFILTRQKFEEPYRVYVNEPPYEGAGKLIDLEQFFETHTRTGYVRPIERLRGIDHPHGPDIVLMLNYHDHFNINEPGGFHPGQHGSLLEDDSITPMIFSGPGVRRDYIAEAFSLNFAPTVANILGVIMPRADGKPLPIFK